MVATQKFDVIISDVEKNLQRSKMYLRTLKWLGGWMDVLFKTLFLVVKIKDVNL